MLLGVGFEVSKAQTISSYLSLPWSYGLRCVLSVPAAAPYLSAGCHAHHHEGHGLEPYNHEPQIQCFFFQVSLVMVFGHSN